MSSQGFRDIAVTISEEQYICLTLLTAQIIWSGEVDDRDEATELAFSAIIDSFLSANYVDMKIFLNRVKTLSSGNGQMDLAFLEIARSYLDAVHSVTG